MSREESRLQVSVGPARVLVVDDDPQGLEASRKILEFSDYQVTTAGDGQAALERLRAQSFDVILSDVRMPKMGGLEFLRALSLMGETTPVVLMTAYGKVEDAVWAMKLGAVDFLSKPFKRQMLLDAVAAALARARAAQKVARTQASVSTFSGESSSGKVTGREPQDRLVGSSSVMRLLKQQLAQLAPTSATVLLQGESGTGKELVARAIHEASPRARGRGKFVALNCAAVPEQLIESELFGAEKGAFTGASATREGLFEAAHEGTILLDEIGDMPLSLQAKLLRVLQEGEVRRVGATQSRRVDVRVIAATHRDLREAVRLGTFRQDLLFRLEVISLKVPALRERPEDIRELAEFFLGEAARKHSKSVSSISREALEVLLAHAWPGNVRELSNVIERAVVFATGSLLEVVDLPPHLLELSREKGAPPLAQRREAIAPGTIEVRLGTPLREVEDLLIRKTLEATSGDKSMTAKLLGINSRTIYRKLGENRSEDKTLEKSSTPPAIDSGIEFESAESPVSHDSLA